MLLLLAHLPASILALLNLEVVAGLGDAGGVLIVFMENLTCFSEVEKSAVSKVLSVISMLREVSIVPFSVVLFPLSWSFGPLKLNRKVVKRGIFFIPPTFPFPSFAGSLCFCDQAVFANWAWWWLAEYFWLHY